MDRLERLVNLVAALLDADRPLSRQQIHQRVGGYADDAEAFRRNFERDKDLLRQMGMPLVLEPLDGGTGEAAEGYRIPRELYELPDPGLSEDELDALRLAGSAVWIDDAWSGGTGAAALRKLAAATSLAGAARSAPASAGGDGGAPGTEVASALVPTDGRVATVFAAVAARQALAFTYRAERRVVDPWHLAFRRGQWYLSAWDHDRQGERMFRLDRVEGDLEVTGSPGAFTRPQAVHDTPPPWRLGDEPEVTAELAVDADQAEWAVTAVGEEAVAGWGEDGSVRLRVAVTNRDGWRSFVLGFLDHAEVVGPPELRREMVSWLDTVAGS